MRIENPALVRGVDLFNACHFWEAHEAWEELWLKSEPDSKQFLQGLIQLSAAYHHVRRGTLRGAVRLFDAALKRLAAFPPSFQGIDRAAAEKAAQEHREWAASQIAGASVFQTLGDSAYPKLVVASTEEAERDSNSR